MKKDFRREKMKAKDLETMLNGWTELYLTYDPTEEDCWEADGITVYADELEHYLSDLEILRVEPDKERLKLIIDREDFLNSDYIQITLTENL